MAKTQLPVNPFPGIRSYEIEEHELFFGRQQQIKELIYRLKKHNFLCVVGSSGCGKSSLVKAGLLAELLKSGKETVHLLHFKPGDDPLGNLAASINQDNSVRIKNELLKDPESLLTHLKSEKQHHTLIFIDQFEELFRFKQDKQSQHIGESAAFVQALLTICAQPKQPFSLILSMRTDFLDHCSEFQGLTEVINNANYLVPRMTKEELREAIVKPIAVLKGDISKDLVAQLLKDTGDDPDQLPILQHAMMRTWDYWKLNKIGNQPISISHYQAIGTIKEALSIHLEEIYTELWGDENRRIAEKMFKALTDFSLEQKVIRRPTAFSEICRLVEARPEKVRKVIDSFREPGRAFLMPAYHQQIEKETVIDISHESIMRIWKRLSNWIEEERGSSELYLRLCKSAALYKVNQSALWIDPELQLAINWREKNQPNEVWGNRYDKSFKEAISFLDESKKAHDAAIRKKEEQQRRNLKRARRFSIILGTAAIISIGLLIYALFLKAEADTSKKEALHKERIALEAGRKAEEQKREAVIQKRISEQQQHLAEEQKKLADEQRRKAVAQHLIALEQSHIAHEEKKKAEQAGYEALLAKEEADIQRQQALIQKDIADQQRLIAETSERNTQRMMLLSTARSLANQASRIYETVEGDLPRLLALQAYNFNKANQGDPYEPDIFQALSTTSENKKTLRNHIDGVRNVGIDNGGQYMATCSDDGKVLIWDLKNLDEAPVNLAQGTEKGTMFRHIAFSGDDRYLVAASSNGRLFCWPLPLTDNKPETVIAHNGLINDLAFQNKGSQFATAGNEGYLKYWFRVDNEFVPRIIDSIPDPIHSVTFSPDEKTFAYCSHNGQIRIYHMKSGKIDSFKTFDQLRPGVLAYSPDGKYLAAGFSDGSIRVWDIVSRDSQSVEIHGRHNSSVSSLLFTGQNKLISSSYDGTVKMGGFLPGDDKPVTLNHHDLWIYDIAVSPDGKQLISASADKTIQVLSIDPELLVRQLNDKTNRNLTLEEWEKYIGEDIQYENTKDGLK